MGVGCDINYPSPAPMRFLGYLVTTLTTPGITHIITFKKGKL